jgi:hypothetical protein
VLQALILFLAAQSIAHGQQRTFKLFLRFLATSTSFHSGLGESEDVYLVSVGLDTQSGEWALARLVDEFPPYRTPLHRADLQSEFPLSMHIRRDPSCDVVYAQMRLRTRPGDPMAILPEPLGFTPALDEPPRKTEIIPCYRTVRK